MSRPSEIDPQRNHRFWRQLVRNQSIAPRVSRRMRYWKFSPAVRSVSAILPQPLARRFRPAPERCDGSSGPCLAGEVNTDRSGYGFGEASLTFGRSETPRVLGIGNEAGFEQR